jgi:hypothetical protein
MLPDIPLMLHFKIYFVHNQPIIMIDEQQSSECPAEITI